MTSNNVEVTVNTCTCTDVLTVITTKDQSDDSYLVNKPCPRATPSVYCHKSLALTITRVMNFIISILAG